MSDTWPCSCPCSQKRAGQAETVTIFIIADETGKRLFLILKDLDAPLAMVCLLRPIPLCYPLTRDERATKRPWPECSTWAISQRLLILRMFLTAAATKNWQEKTGKPLPSVHTMLY